MSTQQPSSSGIWIRFEQSPDDVVVRFFEQPFTLGRAAQCDVRFETRIVSGVHARIAFVRGKWVVQDLDSRNGTFLDGERVQRAILPGRATLNLGEHGPSVAIRVGEAFDGQAAPPARASAAAPPPAPPTVPTPLKPLKAVPRAAPAAAATPPAEAPAPVYHAHRFTLPLADDWQDRTVYTLIGPLNDGLQHNITVNVEPDAPFDTVDDYAAEQISVLEGELQSCRILKQEPIALYNGLPAYRALFVWYPTDEMKVYQEQVYVLHAGTGYRLTASFTRKTRKLLGPQVEGIMLGFAPREAGA